MSHRLWASLPLVLLGCFTDAATEPETTTACGLGACSAGEMCVSWDGPPFEECAAACVPGTACADGCPCIALRSGGGACADNCRAWRDCIDACWSPTTSWGCMPSTPGSCDSIYEKLACEIACDERFHCPRCGGPADRCADAGLVRCDCPEEHGFPCHHSSAFGECRGSSEIEAALAPYASTLQAASIALMDEAGVMHVEVHGGTAMGPVAPDSGFRIASLTKSFVAALVMLLVEDGLVELDTPAASYGVDVPSSITVRQLLRHESGLVFEPDESHARPLDYLQLLLAGADGGPSVPHTPAQLVRLGTPPTLWMPGTFNYSNTNYVVLGMIVESVTGHSLGPILATRLLRPHGLDSIYLEGLVVGEPPVPGVYLTPSGFVSGEGYYHPANAWAAGGLVATAEDLVRWLRALVIERRVLTDASLAEMLDPGEGGEYGFGVYVSSGMVRHDGQYPRAGCTAFAVSTTTGRATAVLTNTEGASGDCSAAGAMAIQLVGL